MHPNQSACFSIQDGKSGKTPMHYAVESKDRHLVEHLFKLVNDTHPQDKTYLARCINQKAFDGNTCLHIAVGLQMHDMDDHKALVRLLMKYGADTCIKNTARQTPRELAKHSEVG